MRILDEIISAASSSENSVAHVLRKLLVLSYKLKNEPLRVWAEKELDGYSQEDDLPAYRVAVAHAKGLFLGGFGQQINDQIIPSFMLKPEHRRFAEKAELRQAIVAYDEGVEADRSGNPRIEWPGNLVALYQASFFEGNLALNRAWQEIPRSALISLVDVVRTRILKFALELSSELSDDEEPDLTALPKATVERIVNYQIFGGHQVFTNSARDITFDSGVKVITGDLGSLKTALKAAGANDDDVVALTSALEADLTDKAPDQPTLGKRTLAWLGSVSGKIATDVAERLIVHYLGLP